jgi:hypothetical protein
MATHLGQDTVLLHPLVKSLEQAIKALILADDDISQTASASFSPTEYIVVLIIIRRGEDLPLQRRFVLPQKKECSLRLTGIHILMVTA